MRPPWGWIAVIGAAWLGLRLPVAFGLPLFMDEALYASEAATGLQDASALFIGSPYARPPLHTWLAMPPIAAGLSPEAAIRLVSLACGAVTAVAVYALATRLGGPRAGLAAAGLQAILPYFVVADVVGVADPVVTAAATSALLLAVRASEPGRGNSAALGLVLGAGVATKLSGLLAVPVALGLTLAAAAARGSVMRGVRAAVVALAFVAATLLLIRVGSETGSITRSESGLTAFRTIGDVVRDPVGAYRTNTEFWSTLIAYVGPGVLGLAVVGLVTRAASARLLAAALAAWWTVATAAAFLVAVAPYARYLMPGIPALVALAGAGAVALSGRLAATGVRAMLAPALVVAVCAAPALWLDLRLVAHPADAPYPELDRWQYVTGFPSGLGYDGLADELRKRSAGERQTVVGYDNLAPLQLGLQLGNPQIEHRSRGISWREPFSVASGGSRWTFVRVTDPRAADARFLLRLVGARVINPLPLDRYRLVAAYTRPEGLSTVQLLELR